MYHGILIKYFKHTEHANINLYMTYTVTILHYFHDVFAC